jgi:lipoprotein-releasing system ATP-binding protein
MSDAAGPPLIEARGLTRIYTATAAPVSVFEDLNLSIPKGGLVAIVGPSGAGKSTLMHLLGGLDRPTRGGVWFQQRNIFDLDARQLADFRNRHIGFVFQFHHLLPEFTVMENTMMPCIIRHMPQPEAEGVSRTILQRVGLAARLDHKVGEISGGEQQRVAIARALAGGPELLLADEPTGNLDQRTGAEVFDMIRGLHEERRLTSVIVTHNDKIAVQCDEVWKMESGVFRPVDLKELA